MCQTERQTFSLVDTVVTEYIYLACGVLVTLEHEHDQDSNHGQKLGRNYPEVILLI